MKSILTLFLRNDVCTKPIAILTCISDSDHNRAVRGIEAESLL